MGIVLSLGGIWQFGVLAKGESLTSFVSAWIYSITVWPMRFIGASFGNSLPLDGHFRPLKSFFFLLVVNGVLFLLLGTLVGWLMNKKGGVGKAS